MRILALVLLVVCMCLDGVHLSTIVAVGLLLVHAELTVRKLQDIEQKAEGASSRVSVYGLEVREMGKIVRRMLIREVQSVNSGGAKEPGETQEKFTA